MERIANSKFLSQNRVLIPLVAVVAIHASLLPQSEPAKSVKHAPHIMPAEAKAQRAILLAIT